MTDLRLQELIQAELDGEISGPDRAELGRVLLQDPQARQEREALRRVDAALRAVPAVDPPEHLRVSILAQAHRPSLRAGGPPRRSPGFNTGLLRYAAVFAGGLVVASLAFYLAQPATHAPDPASLAGTVARQKAAGVPADESLVRAGDGEARLRLFRDRKNLELQIEATTAGRWQFEIDYDPGDLALAGTGEVTGGPGSAGSAPGRLVIPGATGAESRTVRFTARGDGAAEVSVAVRRDGEIVATRTLRAAPAN